MKIFLFLVLALSVNYTLAASEQVYPLNGVSDIHVKSPGKLMLVLSDDKQERLVVSAPSKILAHIKVEHDGSSVAIDYHDGHWYSREPTYTLHLKTVKAIALANGIEFETTSDIQTSQLALSLSGASKAYFNHIDVSEWIVNISGASRIKVKEMNGAEAEMVLSGASKATIKKGDASQLALKLSGASHFNGRDFAVTRADVNFSGASNGRMNVSENIVGALSGASQLTHTGQAKVQVRTSGASNVSQ